MSAPETGVVRAYMSDRATRHSDDSQPDTWNMAHAHHEAQRILADVEPDGHGHAYGAWSNQTALVALPLLIQAAGDYSDGFQGDLARPVVEALHESLAAFVADGGL